MKKLSVLFFLCAPVAFLVWYTFYLPKDQDKKPDPSMLEKIESQNPKEIIDSIAQDIQDGDYETALSKMVENLRHPDIPTSQGQPLIVLAAEKNNYDLVAYLVDQGSQINALEDSTGETALIKAARNGNLEIVIKLISSNANPNIKSQGGVSALTAAAANQHETIATYLLSRGAFAGISDENLLSYAFDNNDVGVDIMLRGGANPNYADANGNTPLIFAASKGNLSAMDKLTAYKADVNAANNNGMTPLLYTIKGGYEDAARFLLNRKETDINKANNNGQTPLFYAAYYGHTDIAQDLLELGADYNKKDKNGNTPLMAARSKKHGVTARAISDFIAFKNLPRDSKGKVVYGKNATAKTSAVRKGNVNKTVAKPKVQKINDDDLPVSESQDTSDNEIVPEEEPKNEDFTGVVSFGPDED